MQHSHRLIYHITDLMRRWLPTEVLFWMTHLRRNNWIKVWWPWSLIRYKRYRWTLLRLFLLLSDDQWMFKIQFNRKYVIVCSQKVFLGCFHGICFTSYEGIWGVIFFFHISMSTKKKLFVTLDSVLSDFKCQKVSDRIPRCERGRVKFITSICATRIFF